MPSSRTTDSRGRRFRGAPNCFHSDPNAVYNIVFPSVCFRASNLANKAKGKQQIKHSILDFDDYLYAKFSYPLPAFQRIVIYYGQTP